MNPEHTHAGAPEGGPSLRGINGAGLLVVVLFFGGLGSWAALAPLQSASLGTGVLSVEGNRRTVQHLEGGIVGRIEVRDGDRVSAGQLLIELDRTRAQASLEQLVSRRRSAVARQARLVAERDEAAAVSFPESLLKLRSEPNTASMLAGETRMFEVRRQALEGRIAILEQRIAQFREEIAGLEEQIEADSRQLALIGEEIAGLESLVKKKLSGSQRLLELKRRAAEIDGNRARRIAEAARVKQNITEERLKILDLSVTRSNEVVVELRDVQALILDLDERIRAARDVLARTRIRAPLSGTVVGLNVHTKGGVVTPGQALLDIVPSGERLVVQARVRPEDIDNVHPGLQAQVILTALNRRNSAPLFGEVTSVSADRLLDERTGAPYFSARIELPDAGGDATLYPGMQAEVVIVTGERTALDYLLRPLTRAFDRALKED